METGNSVNGLFSTSQLSAGKQVDKKIQCRALHWTQGTRFQSCFHCAGFWNLDKSTNQSLCLSTASFAGRRYKTCQKHLKNYYEDYCIFQTIRLTPTPQIWEENGGAFYSLNVAYLVHWGAMEQGFFFLFSSSKTYVLWSNASYSPKNTVNETI